METSDEVKNSEHVTGKMKSSRIIQLGQIRRTQPRGEVGIFALLMILVVLAGSLLLASYSNSMFGWLGFLAGGIIGVPVSFGMMYLVLSLWAIAESCVFSGIPYLPICRDGKCKSGLLTDFGDYEPETDKEFRDYFRCKCGRLYWRNRRERRVLEVLPDGTTKPYMIWRSCRGWFPDV